jgi:hypothetical protein
MKTLYESILDIDDNIEGFDKKIYIEKLSKRPISEKEYDELWDNILKGIKLDSIVIPGKMFSASKGNFLLINKTDRSHPYIHAVSIYCAAPQYPLERQFCRSSKYTFLEYHLDKNDNLYYLFDLNDVYELPKELEWLLTIKK